MPSESLLTSIKLRRNKLQVGNSMGALQFSESLTFPTGFLSLMSINQLFLNKPNDLVGVDENVGGRVDGEKKMVHLTKEKNVKRRVSMSSLSRNVIKKYCFKFKGVKL